MHQTSLFILMLLALFWAAWHFRIFCCFCANPNLEMIFRDGAFCWSSRCFLQFSRLFLLPATVFGIRSISLCFVFFLAASALRPLWMALHHMKKAQEVAQCEHLRKPWKAVKAFARVLFWVSSLWPLKGSRSGRCLYLVAWPCRAGWWHWMLIRPDVLAPGQFYSKCFTTIWQLSGQFRRNKPPAL